MKQGLIFIWFLTCGWARSQATWQAAGNFPGTARDDASGIVCNGKGYMGTGFGAGFVFLNDWWSYHFETDTWTPKTSLPAAPRQYTAITCTGNDVYLLGGITPAGCTDELWMYHTGNDSWELASHFPGGGRQAPVLCAVNGKLYAGLGRCGTIYYNDWWEFDPVQLTWQQLTSFPGEARFDPIHATLNESVLVAAGVSASEGQKDMYAYSAVFKAWQRLPDYTGCSNFYTVQAAGEGLLLVLDGATAGYETCSGAYVYQPGVFENMWRTWNIGELDPPRRGGVCFLYHDRMYYVCGLDTANNRLNKVQYVELQDGAAHENTLEWSLYPTIAEDFICIEASDPFTGAIHIYDASGREVNLPYLFKSERYLRLDISSLTGGLYMARIVNKGGTYSQVKKFVRP